MSRLESFVPYIYIVQNIVEISNSFHVTGKERKKEFMEYLIVNCIISKGPRV